MTRQEMFDKSLEGLRAQDGPSTYRFACAYFGEGDRRCAVGHLLPDALRDTLMRLGINSYPVDGLVRESAACTEGTEKDWAFLRGLSGEDILFLSRLQAALHDGFRSQEVPSGLDWHTWLEEVAEEFAAQEGLTYERP